MWVGEAREEGEARDARETICRVLLENESNVRVHVVVSLTLAVGKGGKFL
jgi:hypothetical protein